MKGFKNKKGISLIVLIITIIVMIILAAAIILSISNSGIVDKANKAKEDSDIASLKEYANVLMAEWELMTNEERENTGKSTMLAYVNAKLDDKGYKDVALAADGEIYTGLNEVAKDALSKGIKIGDKVKYYDGDSEFRDIEVTSYKENNGYKDQIIDETVLFEPRNTNWVYIGISDKGELLIATDGVGSYIGPQFEGLTGYLKGEAELDRLCKELFSITGKGEARSIDIDDVKRLLGYSEEEFKTLWEFDIDDEMKPVLNQELDNGKKIGDSLVNFYEINKDDVQKMKSPENIKYVYYDHSYWLASPYLELARSDIMYFGFRTVDCDDVTSGEVAAFCNSDDVSASSMHFGLRPVVSLSAKITKNSSSGYWEF